jgi:hypothetical protein
MAYLLSYRRPVCLFLAGKVCNHVFDIDQYVSAFEKLKREDILGVEYLVLQTLHFDVYVPRIQDAVHGWYLKLQVRLLQRMAKGSLNT